MDLNEEAYKQTKKQAMKSEFTRLNQWDEQDEQVLKRQRMEMADNIIREKEQQSKAFRKSLAKYDFGQVSVFGTAAGEPVQEFVPAKKAKCRSCQNIYRGNKAKKAIRERSEVDRSQTDRLQKTVDGISYQLQQSIESRNADLERRMEPYPEMQGRRDYDVMKYFSNRLNGVVENYGSNDYERRKIYLQPMTDELLAYNIRVENFTPDYLAKYGGQMYTKVMRFQAFKKVYEDPINRKYFNGLSDMEKQLIQVRILDMADLYENVLRFQCRSLGVDMDNGKFLKEDKDLTERPEELAAVHEFKEEIEHRNERTREIMIAGYGEQLEKEQQKVENLNQRRKVEIENAEDDTLKGTGLTGLMIGYAPSNINDIRKLFVDHPEQYEANKPLLDLMEQEFFRVTDAGSEYTRMTMANNNLQLETTATRLNGTKAEQEGIGFIEAQAGQMTLKNTIITNRLNALQEGMRMIIKGEQPKQKSVANVIEEFRQKLEGREEAVQAQIDEATAGWAQRSLNAIDDEEWRTYERYNGTGDMEGMVTYLDYITGQKEDMYTDQLQENGLREKVYEKLKVKSVDVDVQTSKGTISGLNVSRMIPNVDILTVTADLSTEQAADMLYKVAQGKFESDEVKKMKSEKMDTEQLKEEERKAGQRDADTEEGLREFKHAVYKHLKRMEAKYGKMLTQLHPEDALRKVNIHEWGMDTRLTQDMVQLIDNNETGIKLFTEDKEDKNYKEDMEYIALARYYFHAAGALNSYIQAHIAVATGEDLQFCSNMVMEEMEKARKYEDGVQEGPALKMSQMPYYEQYVRKRYRGNENPLKKQGYGRW